MYTQIVYPDLTTVGLIGWCLSFVEDAYNTPHLGATATDAWNDTRHPHKLESLPANVQVPVWYSYWENGLNFGHVAINVPGRGVLSSPYKANGTQQWFKDVEECRRVMGCQAYLGWSEDLATVQLISEGGDVSTVGEVEFNDLYRAFFGPMEVNPPTDNDRKRWIGAETNTVIRAMEADPRHSAWLGYIEDLKKPSKFKPYTGNQLYEQA